jgi:transcriptional regulator with XRE-family HTH domain
MIEAVSGRALLSAVLRGARQTLGDRSPEQVARAAGVSGRTIRRLEEGEFEHRPRAVTLDALAGFYGLRAGFLRDLAAWTTLPDREVATRLHAAARNTLGNAEDVDEEPPEELAMRLARAGRSDANEGAWARTFDLLLADEDHRVAAVEFKAAGRDAEVLGLMRTFLTLDRRRQRLLLEVAAELDAARQRENPAD